MPSKSSLALANIEVDIGDIPEGKTVTIMWQGKPVFLRKRTDAEIEDMRAVPMDALKDPQTDEVLSLCCFKCFTSSFCRNVWGREDGLSSWLCAHTWAVCP